MVGDGSRGQIWGIKGIKSVQNDANNLEKLKNGRKMGLTGSILGLTLSGRIGAG